MFPDFMRDDVFRLETARLWLRWPNVRDAATLEKNMSAAAMGFDPGAERPAQAWVIRARKENLAGGALHLALARRSRPQTPIGWLSLESRSGGDAALARLEGWLNEPSRGAGLMEEALAALIDFVWSATALRGLEASAAAPGDMLERVGFRALADDGAAQGGARYRIERPAAFRFPPAAGARREEA